jgi:hypothetical protein
MSIAVVGLLAPRCPPLVRKTWNEALHALYGDGVFFDYYRTVTRADLEQRLSEMFVLQRRAYCIDPSFASIILPFLDRLDASSQQSGVCDTVINEDGVLVGYDSHDLFTTTHLSERLKSAKLTCDFSYSSS